MGEMGVDGGEKGGCRTGRMRWIDGGQEILTENEFLGWCQHVQRECNLFRPSICVPWSPRRGSQSLTSYWYLFLCSHRNVDANIVIVSDLLECFEVYWGAVSSGVVGRESRGETKGSKGRRWIVNGSPI